MIVILPPKNTEELHFWINNNIFLFQNLVVNIWNKYVLFKYIISFYEMLLILFNTVWHIGNEKYHIIIKVNTTYPKFNYSYCILINNLTIDLVQKKNSSIFFNNSQNFLKRVHTIYTYTHIIQTNTNSFSYNVKLKYLNKKVKMIIPFHFKNLENQTHSIIPFHSDSSSEHNLIFKNFDA